MKKISVIIPIYNAEGYLKRCINSILKQTFSNLEILLVNDGSTDESKNICTEYEKMDKRIRVINQENQGVSRARTTGLEHATGELIGFADADDWCAPQMYEVLYKLLEDTGAGISKCQFAEVYSIEDAEKYKNKNNENEIEQSEIYTSVEFTNRIFRLEEENYLYDKLFKREVLIENWCTFPRNRFAEDMSVMYRIIAKCSKIVVTDQVLYYYFQNMSGLSEAVNQNKYRSFVAILREMDIYYKDKPYADEYHDFRIFLLLRAYIECVKYMTQKKILDVEQRNRVAKEEREIYMQYKEAFDKSGFLKQRKTKMFLKKLLVRIGIMKPVIMLLRRKSRG